MIIYKDVLKTIKKETGLSISQLKKNGLLSDSTATRIRRNMVISTESIDVICNLLHCQPNDIMEVVFEDTLSPNTNPEEYQEIQNMRQDFRTAMQNERMATVSPMLKLGAEQKEKKAAKKTRRKKEV